MRLTEKETTEMFDNLTTYYSTEKHLEAIEKLGQLEDILEKYNIDTNEELEVLCKYAEDVRHWMSIYKEKMLEIRKIEDELGIDLITLFKILKRKIIYHLNEYDKKIQQMVMYGECDLTGISVYEKGFEYLECAKHLPYKDYGKTWALTKEELL